MIRIDDSPISDFIVINNDKEYEILHSYPTTLYSLFVDIDSIVPCLKIEEVDTSKMCRVLMKNRKKLKYYK